MLKRRSPDWRLNLSSNELHHPEAEPLLRDALMGVAPDAARRYPETSEAIRELAARAEVVVDELWLTPGSDIAIRKITESYAAELGSARRLLLQDPNYWAWQMAAKHCEVEIQRVPIDPASVEAQTAHLLDSARSLSRCLIAISVPNGPGGWAIGESELDALVELADAREHLLVIDACYQAFHGAFNAHTRRRGAQVLVVQSLSKSHGLAGARFALVYGSSQRLARLGASNLEQCVSGISVQLAVAVLRESAAFERIWKDIASARSLVTAHFDAAGVPTLPARANFVTLRAGSPADAAMVVESMSQAGYRVRDLGAVSQLHGWVRFTLADPTATGAALDTLSTALGIAGPHQGVRSCS